MTKANILYVLKFYVEDTLHMEFVVGYNTGRRKTYGIATVPQTVRDYMKTATVKETRDGKCVCVEYSND